MIEIMSPESLNNGKEREVQPFRVKDDNILKFQEDEESRRIAQRRDNQKLKIWEKDCDQATRSKERTKWIRSLVVDKNEEDEQKEMNNEKDRRMKLTSKGIVEKLEKYLDSKETRGKHKESLPDFIAKKKDLSLLQMSLDIKKEEIEKLDETLRMKEESLDASEKLLEEDALRFDLFLKDNHKKAQDAWRAAEKETKRKMEKIQEIKKLNKTLQIIQSSTNKCKDSLEECAQYKIFLDILTPSHWVEEGIKTKRSRQRNRRLERIKRRQQIWKTEQEEIIAKEQMLNARKDVGPIRKKRGKRRVRNNVTVDKDPPPKPALLPPMPDFEDEPLTSSDEDIPMYFNEPKKLFNFFSSMEEENLFLIQNAQEAEQSLDEMSSRFQDSRNEVKRKVDKMQLNINQLKNSIDSKQEQIKMSKDHIESQNSSTQSQEEQSMYLLTKKVKEVYHQCGFHDAGTTPGTLFMLSEIEACMEDILLRLEPLPDNEFIKADKLKEKKRREAKRAQKQAEQTRLQEEKNRKVIERSTLPPKKTTRKKV